MGSAQGPHQEEKGPNLCGKSRVTCRVARPRMSLGLLSGSPLSCAPEAHLSPSPAWDMLLRPGTWRDPGGEGAAPCCECVSTGPGQGVGDAEELGSEGQGMALLLTAVQTLEGCQGASEGIVTQGITGCHQCSSHHGCLLGPMATIAPC